MFRLTFLQHDLALLCLQQHALVRFEVVVVGEGLCEAIGIVNIDISQVCRRHTHTHTHVDTHRQRQTHTQTETQTQTETHRQRHRHPHTDTRRHTDTDTHTDTHRQRHTQTHTDTHTQTHTQTSSFNSPPPGSYIPQLYVANRDLNEDRLPILAVDNPSQCIGHLILSSRLLDTLNYLLPNTRKKLKA